MDDSNVLDFKTAGMQRAGNRDSQVSKGRQFGIGNFFSWAMEKYPRMTLGQLEQKMPQLEREYGQEKTMRKAEPDMKPSVNSAFDDRDEEMKAKGISQEGKSPHKKGTTKYKKHMAAMHAEAKDLARIKKLAGIEITEEEVTKDVIGHVDNESNMLRKELFKIGKDSIELYKMLDKLPEGDFPHWWQAKVVKSGEYISSAKGYLEAELYAPEEESPLDDVQDDDLNPSGV
jgi:hypothetical protein